MGCLQVKKKEDTETKKVIGDLKIPKLEEIFTTVAIAWHRHARLAGFENN